MAQTKTKKRIETCAMWLRVVGITVLMGIGFMLSLHDTNSPTTSWIWVCSIMARIIGIAILYGTLFIGTRLADKGKLPLFLKTEE